MKDKHFTEIDALKDLLRQAETELQHLGEKATGEHYEIFAGCLNNYIEKMETAQKEIYAEAKRINEHSERMMKAIERAIGHIKDFHD